MFFQNCNSQLAHSPNVAIPDPINIFVLVLVLFYLEKKIFARFYHEFLSAINFWIVSCHKWLVNSRRTLVDHVKGHTKTYAPIQTSLITVTLKSQSDDKKRQVLSVVVQVAQSWSSKNIYSVVLLDEWKMSSWKQHLQPKFKIIVLLSWSIFCIIQTEAFIVVQRNMYIFHINSYFGQTHFST